MTTQPTDNDPFDSTMTRALSDAERASVEAAQSALARGAIKQREVSAGVFCLVRG
jgi:hypothetical protein